MKLDKDEIIIFKPKRTLITKILYSFIIITCIALIFYLLPGLNKSKIVLIVIFLLIFLTYWLIYSLCSNVILTNKKIVYQNIFFKHKCIWLKNIIYIGIIKPATSDLSQIIYDLQNISTLFFKLSNSFFPKILIVPDPEDFKEKTLEYIESNLKQNNLDQKAMRKSFLYKIGVYCDWKI